MFGLPSGNDACLTTPDRFPVPPRPLPLQISLDARRIRLMRLPEGKASSSSSSSGTRQTVYEVCVCANGRLFLSQAGTGSTCQISNNVCL